MSRSRERRRALLRAGASIALSAASVAAAMGLLPDGESRAAWQALEPQVLAALGGDCGPVQRAAARVSAVDSPRAGGGLALNRPVIAGLRPLAAVTFVVAPEQARGKADSKGGLLEVTPPTTGTYVLGTASVAWIDLADEAGRALAKPRLYRWVDFCGRRMKAGVFELPAGQRRWIQISASPDATIDLFFAGPLDQVPNHAPPSKR